MNDPQIDTKHNMKEPWSYSMDHIYNSDGEAVAYDLQNDDEGKRIVECVNALKGIQNPGETIAKMVDALKRIEFCEHENGSILTISDARNLATEALAGVTK